MEQVTHNDKTSGLICRTIHGLLYTALKALIDMDPELYNKCEQDYEQSCLNRQHEFDERQHRWQLIQQQATKLHYDAPDANHVDVPDSITHESTMQIDSNTTINVPEQIPEEPERQQDDTSMTVDPVSPPAA